MIDATRAATLAQTAVDERLLVDRARVRETKEGWFFPYKPTDLIGSSGVIVHKRSGKVLVLGSAFSVERDIAAFDNGYQFSCYDLVVLEVHDESAALDILIKVAPTSVVPEYESGQVWRVPRRLSRSEIAARLTRLPAIFPEIQLYFVVEALEEARSTDAFRFEAIEFRSRA